MAWHMTWHSMAWHGMAWHDIAWPPFPKAPTPNRLGWASCATLGAPSPAPPMPWVLFLRDPRTRCTVTSEHCCPGDTAPLAAPGHAQVPNSQSSPCMLLKTGAPQLPCPQPPARQCPSAGHPHHRRQAWRCPPPPNRCCPLFLAGAGAVRGAPRVPVPIANPSSPTANPSSPIAKPSTARCGQGAGRQPPSPLSPRRQGAMSTPGRRAQPAPLTMCCPGLVASPAAPASGSPPLPSAQCSVGWEPGG